MWSRAFFVHFGGRPWPSDHDNQKKRRSRKHHASSSSDKFTQSNAHSSVAKPNWWSQQKAAIGNAFAGMGATFEKMKPKGLEVKVDVDMIKPTLESFQKSGHETWASIPEPVRVASKYLSVAILSAWLMNKRNQRQLQAQTKVREELEVEVIKLKGANEALQNQDAFFRQGISEYTKDLGIAVATATTSAARAAEAAAVASETCAVRSRRGIRPRKAED